MIETTPLRKKLLDLAISGKLVPKTGEWKTVKLGEVFKFIDYRGKTPKKILNGVPLLTAKNIRRGFIDYSVRDYISQEEYRSRQSRGVSKKGDILFTTEAPLGCVALADLEEYSTGQRIITLQQKGIGVIDNECFLHFMLSPSWQEYLLDHKTGTTVAGIKAEVLKGLEIPLPPLAEQKAIVKRLEELLALEREIAADSAALDDLITAAKRRILDLAISGKLVPKTGEWKMVKLGEVGEFCGGHTPSKANAEFWGGEYLWVTSKDMKSKYIDDTAIKLTKSGADELESLPVGTLLMTTRSGILRRKFPVAIARKPCTINQDQKALRVGCDAIPEFVYVVLSALEDVILKKYVKSGTTVESVIWNKFLNIEISLPPLAEQKRIVARVEELLGIVAAINV